MNTARLHGAANAHTVRRSCSTKGFDLGDRMVISFALAVTQPRQARHGHQNDPDSNPKFGLFFHGDRLQLFRKSESYHRLRTAKVTWLTLARSVKSKANRSFSSNSPPSWALFSASNTGASSLETRITR